MTVAGKERVVPVPNADRMASPHVRVLFQDSEGFMWYGMKSDGLYSDDGYNLAVIRADFLHPEVQMNNNITAICEDGRGRLWIGTKRGLYILDKLDYSIYPTGDEELQIWTFDALKASGGDSVQAYANRQVLTYDGEGRCVGRTPVETNPLVTQSRKELTDRRGNFWQIDDNGIPSVKMRPVAELKEVELAELPLCGNVPVDWIELPEEQHKHNVWRDADSTMYASTNKGLWVARKGEEPEQQGPEFGVVNALSPGEDGTIYMNTEWQGLVSYTNGIVERLDQSIRNAFNICFDQGKLWICTSDGKLLLYDVATKEKVDMSNQCRLQGDAPIGLAVLQGKVWLLFDHRLLIYTISENPDDKPVMRCISPSDLEPRPAFFRGLYTDGKSRIFLECEQKSYELLLTDGGQKMDEEEAIVLSAYETANGMRRPGMNTNQLNLEADERVVHLYLTTFDHMNTRHVRFAYRYRGEQEWQYLEMGKNDVLLTRLSRGEQTVEVMATGVDGQWNEYVLELTIFCKPHWWESAWAYAAYVLGALVLLAAGFWSASLLKKSPQ